MSGQIDEPMPGIKTHGDFGYKQGCRCFVCRRVHADKMNAYRDKRRRNGGDPLGQTERVVIPPGVGSVERRVRIQIGALGVATDEGRMLEELALMNARLLDEIPNNGRWHLMGTAQRLLLDAMDRLQEAGGGKKPKTAEEGLDDFVDGLEAPGRPG